MNLPRGCVALIALLGFMLSAGSLAHATPAQIIFLRHAEKPPDGPELSTRGWARAKALAGLFSHDARTQEHGPIAAIYAMKVAKPGDSVRAIQTMEPTAAALHVAIKSKILRDEIDDLVQTIRKAKSANGKTVVVCWEHKVLPEILRAFGWTTGPKKWDDETYDRLWVLDFENGLPSRFRDLPQKLLPGDAEK